MNRDIKESVMNDYLAIGIAEGFEEAESEEQVLNAWQYLVDTGLAYRLQGWFGRTAQTLIDQGLIRKKSFTTETKESDNEN
jgi:hypothetical protein